MSFIDTLNGYVRRCPTWPLYVAAIVPVVWVFYAGIVGQLGVDPVKAIEHRLGLWSLWLLIAGLCVTPLARFISIRLIKFRRAIGVVAFFYVFAHLLVWLILDVQILSQVWQDILKRPYITIGMAAFVLLIPLALTSNNLSIRKLGAASWQRLHKLTYAVVLLGGMHYVMVVKGWQVEPMIYFAVIVGLLALRLIPKRKPARTTAPRPTIG